MSENVLDVLLDFATQQDDPNLAEEAKKALVNIYQHVEKLKELGFPEEKIYIGAKTEDGGLTSFQFYCHEVEIIELKSYDDFKQENGITDD